VLVPNVSDPLKIIPIIINPVHAEWDKIADETACADRRVPPTAHVSESVGNMGEGIGVKVLADETQSRQVVDRLD
jgi:hypothetical protein